MSKKNSTNTCKLLQTENPGESDIDLYNFKLIKTFEEESHLIRRLLKCKDCRQLYFYEFYEIIDWVGGNDSQYRTFIPVDSIKKAEEMSKVTPMELLKCIPRLQKDWPSDQESPKIFWVK